MLARTLRVQILLLMGAILPARGSVGYDTYVFVKIYFKDVFGPALGNCFLFGGLPFEIGDCYGLTMKKRETF